MNLSAIVLTKNEEENITECLKSLKFCDERIVIDDNSTDKTVEIAHKLGVKVFTHSLNDNFAEQRNFALRQAQGRWVLFVDADETVSAKLATEISNLKFQISNLSGFYIKRTDFMWGRQLKHGETGNVSFLRLGRKTAGKWRRQVHEVWDVIGKTGELKNPLLHYPHQSLREFLTEINWMSTLHTKANKEERKRSSIVKIILWPKIKFLQNWILRLGFLDGTAGFIVALMMSFHSFLAWGKLWILQKETT